VNGHVLEEPKFNIINSLFWEFPVRAESDGTVVGYSLIDPLSEFGLIFHVNNASVEFVHKKDMTTEEQEKYL
jgi:hypothetical protein